jgi:hypothetical protein
MKISLTTAIHQIKTEFKRTFGDKYKHSSDLEKIINLAAVEVKKGFDFEWYENNGPKIRFFPRAKWIAPKPMRTYD